MGALKEGIQELVTKVENAQAEAFVTPRDGGSCSRTCIVPAVFPELPRCSDRRGPPGGVRGADEGFGTESR